MFTGIDFLQFFLILITAALIGSFLIFFYYPSYDLGNKFSKVINALNSLKQNKNDSNIPERILNDVMVTSTLNHLWSEYCETLHDQSNFVDGEEVTLQIRATLPSEVFFNTQTLVDTPLRTEFFKHLPGIFTGIGIIGTFKGLISGLHAFQFSDNPVALKLSLSNLLGSVSDAFIFSASTIAIAMVVILLEKVATTKRYKQVEEICQIIDSFFDAGASEEYLASIVKSSERSATATAHLRDVAVKDLKMLLTNLNDQQIKAAQDNNKFIAKSISDSIATSLKGPLETLANVAEKAVDQDGKAVESMLKNLISGFMAKLEETFGGQMSGLNTMMLETTNSMKVMQENFSQMLSLMSDAGKSAGEAMGEQMKEALTIAELRQKEMNAQMEQFISALKETVSQSQMESNTQFKVMLDNINQNMTGLIENLNAQQAGVIEKATVTQQALGESTQNAVSNLHEQMNELIARNAETASAMRENIEALQKVTINSIEKMKDGAETLYTASAEFSKAGNGMTNVLEKTTILTNNLVTAGQNLETTSRTIQSIISEFKDTRLAISGMTESLNLIIERAKSEAGMTNEMLTKMKAITDSFNKAQIDTEDYLQKVSGVMESSFTAFSTSMATALDKSRTDFDKSLSSAVGMLRAVIEDLAENNDKA